jgi:hypothetical protein
VSIGVGKIDPPKEAEYREVWKTGMAAVVKANEGLRGGVCDVGGDAHGCYDASAKTAEALDALLASLSAATVPPRYEANGSDADFVAGNDMLKVAFPALQQAYAKFPSDARPQPAP